MNIAFTPISFLAHGFPAIIMLIDFAINTITFDWRHLWIQFGMGVVYTLGNIGMHFDRSYNAYPTSDWTNRTGGALAATASCFIVQVLSFWLLVVLSKKKL